MDRAIDAGIDFFDTAEMYPVPPSAELFGVTEQIVGKLLKGRMRGEIIVATKVTGPGHGWFRPPIRGGFTALDRRQIFQACEDSLRRLQTDYIDLYQTHWPDHGMEQAETLGALTDLIDQGKIRALVNSTALSHADKVFTYVAANVAAESDRKTCHLRQAPRDERRLRVLAEAEAVDDARGDGDDVLDDTRDLATRHV
jgi:aryl-alcohol dehydrogenase-like predicted oxidoreductase